MIAFVVAALLAGGAPVPQQAASPAPAPSPEPTPLPSVQELYQKIVPPAGEEVAGQESGGQAVPADAARAEEQSGFRFGFLRFRPSLRVSYIDADNAFLESGGPVRAHYFQIEPNLGLGMGVSGQVGFRGISLRLSYEPKFRASTKLDVLKHPTHLFDGRLTLPLGSAVTLSGSHHYARGLMETTEVDPGREYFFRLGRFTHKASQATASFNAHGRLRLDATGSYDTQHIEDPGTFFDHETRGLTGDLRYEVGSDLTADLKYSFQRIPRPPEHPEAQSDVQTASFGLEGALGPLLKADAHFGFQDRRNPLAGPGGTQYRGFAADARLVKEFTPTSSISLFGSRVTYPSAFEENGFYVADGGGADLTTELPFSFAARAAVGLQRNSYRVPNAEGVRRHDDIFSWSVGLGRPVTRWGYLRADYRRDRRESNIDAFDTRGNSLIIQVGIGYLAGPGAPR